MKPAKITPRRKATGVEKKPRATGVEKKPRATGVQKKPRAASGVEKKSMATGAQRKPRATGVQAKHKAGEVQMEHRAMEMEKEYKSTPISTGVNFIKRPHGQRCYATGPDDPVFVEIHQGSFPSNTVPTSGPQLQVQDTHFRGKTTKSPSPNLDAGKIPQQSYPSNGVHALGLDKTTNYLSTNLDVERTPQPSAKIKLQLFPIDEFTRIGLEKDGYHPYLELTLSVRKKVSSILKHLTGKWGTSTIAFGGEPVLFPYDASTDSTGSTKKWTSNDTETNAGDVFAAVGRPGIFRLRYGWMCYRMPSMSIPLETCTNFVKAQEADRAHLEDTNEKEKWVDRKDTELEQNKWDDSLTNISIGGLLSEASLQGRSNNCDSNPNQSNWGLHPTQLISDSLDAFLTRQVKQSEGSMQVSHNSHLSILDNEQTCHAFSFQKVSSHCEDSFDLNGKANSGYPTLNAVSKSVNVQVGIPEDGDHQEAKTHVPLSSGVYNDDSSLGLGAFLWDNSQGAFGPGL